MEVEGPPPPPSPRPQPLLDRLQHCIASLRGQPDVCKFIIMFAIAILCLGAIMGVVVRHKVHHHPHVALWCKPNATVSLEGALGEFSSITQAIDAAPSFSTNRYCIHIRRGRYTENVVIGPEKTNLTLVGDGVGKTILAANRTCGGQYCELQVATLLVQGVGFIAIDLAIENFEEPVNLAAAAVENWSDKSIFYRCSLRSHHQVVRAHKFRQFYRESDIKGSGSLIYGGAQAFFQNCRIAIERSTKNVADIVAEQLTVEQRFKGGFTFHLCDISAYPDPTSIPILGAARTPNSQIAYLECSINLKLANWSNNGFTSGALVFAEYGNTRFGSSYSSSSPDVSTLDFSSASELSLGRSFQEDWIPSDIPHQQNLGR